MIINEVSYLYICWDSKHIFLSIWQTLNVYYSRFRLLLDMASIKSTTKI